jgi:hypothetical protein
MVEITRCVEAGLLLASAQVTCSAWEHVVRRAVVKARAIRTNASSEQDRSRLESELLATAEDERNLTLPSMLEELVREHILTSSEATTMQGLYRRVRIPLHHGIIGRYVRSRSDTTMSELLGISSSLDSHSFEEQLETNAVTELEEILDQVELLCSRRAV